MSYEMLNKKDQPNRMRVAERDTMMDYCGIKKGKVMQVPL